MLLPRRQVPMGAPGKNQEVGERAPTPSTESVLPHHLESRQIWKHSQTDAGSGEFGPDRPRPSLKHIDRERSSSSGLASLPLLMDGGLYF